MTVVAGAAPATEVEAWLATAGFCNVHVNVKLESRDLVARWAPGRGIEDYVASATIEARKPEANESCCAPAPSAPSACCSTTAKSP